MAASLNCHSAQGFNVNQLKLFKEERESCVDDVKIQKNTHAVVLVLAD